MPLFKGKVAGRDLTPALQDKVPYLLLQGEDGGDGTGQMDIQVFDVAGKTLAERLRVRTWISTSDFGAPEVMEAGDFSVAGGSGVELRQVVADADYEVICDVAGQILMDIDAAGDDTFYVMAEIDGRIYSGSVAITGN